MRCPRCRHVNETGASFCEECAAPLRRACVRCGRALSPTAKFCPGCAHPIGAAAPPARFDAPDAYTPAALAERILTSRAALEGERKHVSVLFADVKGSMELFADRDPEEARRILDPVLELMMEAVHRFEGTVNQVMGDGIMALFGAPLAHEDHAVRACYAALRMLESVRRYAEEVHRTAAVPVHIRVGVNSGEVVVRSIRSDLRMDYTAVGQTTNVAARLEQMAMPGTILVSPATLALAEGHVTVRPLGARPVKGLDEPLPVFELVGAGPARSRLQATARRGLSRFVGRDAELDQLAAGLALARAGRGQVVALVAEPGMGKSRLLWEFVDSPRVHGAQVLQAAAAAHEHSTAYLPLIELLRSFLGLDGREDPQSVRDTLAGTIRALGLAPDVDAPALLTLLGVPTENAAWEELDPVQRRQRTLDALVRLLLRQGEREPLVLVLEDLHWVDAETQAWLDRLVERLAGARLLLVVTFRPEYRHGWAGKTYYRQLRLDPLAADPAAELLVSLLGDDPGLVPLERLLVDRTQGNPLFLEESVRTLVETGALAGERGAYRLARSPEAIHVPASVQAILAARIDRLAAEDKRLLQAAAVVGTDVPFALLQAVAEAPDDELRAGLARLQGAELLYETRLFPDLEYTFRHALTHEVAYGSVLHERRRALHGRILEALEQLPAGRQDEQVELLAHHAARAERWDRAACHLYRAGQKAFAHARYETAAAAHQAAVEALDRLGAAADAALKLDASLELWAARNSLGKYDDLAALAGRAETLARGLGDGPRLAQVQLRRAQAIATSCAMPGTLEEAIALAREASEHAAPDDLRTRSYARFVVGHAAHDLGRLEEALAEFEAGLALFDPAAPSDEAPGLALPIYVSLSAWRAQSLAAIGEFEPALAAAREALRVAADIRHGSSLAVAHMFLGAVHAARGEMEAALPWLERGLAIADEHHLHLGTVRAAAHLAYPLVVLGHHDRGLQCLARARARSDEARVAHHGPATEYGVVTATAYLAARRRREADLEVRHGLAAAAARHAHLYRPSLRRLEGELAAETDSALATRCLEEALALATELGLRPEAAHCHVGLGRLCERTGPREQARAHVATAATMYRDMGMTYWLERVEAALGS